MCRHGFTTGSSPFGEEKKVMKWLQHKMLSDVTEGDTKPYASPKEANTWLCWVGVGGGGRSNDFWIFTSHFPAHASALPGGPHP